MSVLCCGDNKQDKNESTMIHLPTCQSFELLHVPSNIKLSKQHSWQVMHLISATTFGQIQTNFQGDVDLDLAEFVAKEDMKCFVDGSKVRE